MGVTQTSGQSNIPFKKITMSPRVSGRSVAFTNLPKSSYQVTQ